jgi:hypothetical protein
MAYITTCPACYMATMPTDQDGIEELMRLVSAMYDDAVVRCVTPGHWTLRESLEVAQ